MSIAALLCTGNYLRTYGKIQRVETAKFKSALAKKKLKINAPFTNNGG